MKTFSEPCGCKWTTTRQGSEQWVELCPPHKAEHDERHQRAQEDYRAQQRARDASAAK